MNTSFWLFIAFLAILVALNVYLFLKEREPRITVMSLPDDHYRLMLEYWSYYSWYDNNGNQIWSKRKVRKPLLTL